MQMHWQRNKTNKTNKTHKTHRCVELFGGAEGFENRKELDARKREICNSNERLWRLRNGS